MVTTGDSQIIEQIKKQLFKLINVIKVHDLSDTDCVRRELILIKVSAKPGNRAEILRIADIFRAKIVDVSTEHYTIEITGNEEKLKAIQVLLKPIGIMEIARTGNIALLRESK